MPLERPSNASPRNRSPVLAQRGAGLVGGQYLAVAAVGHLDEPPQAMLPQGGGKVIGEAVIHDAPDAAVDHQAGGAQQPQPVPDGVLRGVEGHREVTDAELLDDIVSARSARP
jgi:hypothetical protein